MGSCMTLPGAMLVTVLRLLVRGLLLLTALVVSATLDLRLCSTLLVRVMSLVCAEANDGSGALSFETLLWMVDRSIVLAYDG